MYKKVRYDYNQYFYRPAMNNYLTHNIKLEFRQSGRNVISVTTELL